MNKAQIDRYFTTLSKAYPGRCRILVTGAAAGALYGRVRATMDIDFEVETPNWKRFTEAVRVTGVRTGITAQYAEDIDHWSMISFGDYARHTYAYKKFGGIEVRLMEPAYWAIGKLSRYLDSDIQDMVKVFKKTGTRWEELALVAGKALKKSHKSTACFLFKRQVGDFFKRSGKRVWGPGFDLKKAVERFHKEAGAFQLTQDKR